MADLHDDETATEMVKRSVGSDGTTHSLFAYIISAWVEANGSRCARITGLFRGLPA